MTEWQPIETAPKDGTEIIVYRPDCGMLIAQWTSPEAFVSEAAAENMGDELFEDDWYSHDFGGAYRISNDGLPTHWMPLPPPPTDQDSREDGR